jgi:hypothetical protein
MKNNILRANTRGKIAIDLNPHVFAALRDQSLRRKDVFDLRSADAKSQSSERAMCGCVTVSTDDCCTRECETLLGADDMHDALALVTESEVCDAEVFDIVFERHALEAGVFFLDERFNVLESFARGSGDVLLPLSAYVGKLSH